MTSQDPAPPLDEQQSVVHGVNAPPRIHLIAANYHVGIGLGCGVAKAFGVFTGNQESLIVELNANRYPVLEFRLPTFTPIGIACQPGLSKGDELGTVACSFVNLLTDTVHAFLSIKVNRRRLHHPHVNKTASVDNILCWI